VFGEAKIFAGAAVVNDPRAYGRRARDLHSDAIGSELLAVTGIQRSIFKDQCSRLGGFELNLER
jgi:hypothetical protein